MKYLTFALAKGRLAKKSLALFEQIGISMDEMKDPDTRKLIFVNEDLKIKMFLAKASDVPTYVEYGAADIGVVGKDTLLEEGRRLYEVLDLGFGRCRFALAGKVGNNFYEGCGVKTIATKYPNITRRFFESKAMDVDIVKIEGSVELAPLLELSDGIVDIVETGTTLKENGLEVYEYVSPISARVIVNPVSMKLKKNSIEDLIDKMESNI